MKKLDRTLTPEEKAQVEALGGWDALMKRMKEILDEQTDRHEGGSKWFGTGGTSPFGNGGYHPEGIRVGRRVGGQSHRREGLGVAGLSRLRRSG